MNNLKLHGRLPEDLPDKETIDDILLELQDTKQFEISWFDLNSFSSYINWHGNGKPFQQWAESGQVAIMKCDPIPTFNIPEDWWSNDTITTPMSTMTYKEYRYDIFRYPIRLEVKLQVPINKIFRETIESAKETYLRIKDYLGPDVIQDQIDLASFTIDFMISEVKLNKDFMISKLNII